MPSSFKIFTRGGSSKRLNGFPALSEPAAALAFSIISDSSAFSRTSSSGANPFTYSLSSSRSSSLSGSMGLPLMLNDSTAWSIA